MTNVLVAINILIALTELASQLGPRLARVAELIQTAQAEGRDLTDAELTEIEAARVAAVDEWRSMDEKTAP